MTAPGPDPMPPRPVPARCAAGDEQLTCVLPNGHVEQFRRPGKPGLIEAHLDGSFARGGEVTGLTAWRETGGD